MKTSELSGAALDWAVAKATGEYKPVAVPAYSTDWSQGGPIIERECITVSALYAQKNPPSPEYAHGEWGAYIPCGVNSEASGRGNTPLIAAMRCYVTSRLGEDIELPEAL